MAEQDRPVALSDADLDRVVGGVGIKPKIEKKDKSSPAEIMESIAAVSSHAVEQVTPHVVKSIPSPGSGDHDPMSKADMLAHKLDHTGGDHRHDLTDKLKHQGAGEAGMVPDFKAAWHRLHDHFEADAKKISKDPDGKHETDMHRAKDALESFQHDIEYLKKTGKLEASVLASQIQEVIKEYRHDHAAKAGDVISAEKEHHKHPNDAPDWMQRTEQQAMAYLVGALQKDAGTMSGMMANEAQAKRTDAESDKAAAEAEKMSQVEIKHATSEALDNSVKAIISFIKDLQDAKAERMEVFVRR